MRGGKLMAGVRARTEQVTENEKTGQNDLLTAMDTIRTHAEEQGLTEEFFAGARWQLEAVAGPLNITPAQTALLALLLEYSGTEKASLTGLAETLRCGRIATLRHMDDLGELERKHLIASTSDNDYDVFLEPASFMKKRRGIANPSYVVPMDVFNAIKAGRPYRYTVYCNLSPEEFFTAADSLLKAFRRNDLSAAQFRNEILFLFNSNRDSAFVRGIKKLGLHFADAMILLAFCAALVEDDVYSLGIKAIRGLLRNIRIIVMRFKSGDHPLFDQGLLENACGDGMADTEEFCLTGKARDLLLPDLDLKERKQRRGDNFIAADKIAEKELSYSERLRDRVAELTSLLGEENFVLVKARLRERNMRAGFACLFSGPPGTGKTETAYQIARKTGRDIMLVDIANTKSKWFGESEKKIKALFDRYQGMVKNSPLAPILLFNEADAVLGKRINLGEDRQGPGQTENAIQNIILQEMENLSGGILIATTNMTGNLDKAFERRFLYKIEFEQPDAGAKRAIWKNMLPGLDEGDIGILSSRFDLSGGQIENVARKATVAELLHGKEPAIGELVAYCEEESMAKQQALIGFRA
jgi:hypothetical protein